MRAAVTFAFATIPLAFALSQAPAETSLTKEQVNNVCGKALASGGGYSGCDKKCGNQICDYHCGPDGKCGAFVVKMTAGGSSGPKGSAWLERSHVEGSLQPTTAGPAATTGSKAKLPASGTTTPGR
jgi:hypothetical protein